MSRWRTRQAVARLGRAAQSTQKTGQGQSWVVLQRLRGWRLRPGLPGAPSLRGRQSCCMDPDSPGTHGLVIPYLRRTPWPTFPSRGKRSQVSVGLGNLACRALSSPAGRSLLLCGCCRFSVCTTHQLRANKTQPLSEEQGRQLSCILQRQAGEGFKLPQTIWLWASCSWGKERGFGAPEKKYTAGGRRIFHCKN